MIWLLFLACSAEPISEDDGQEFGGVDHIIDVWSSTYAICQPPDDFPCGEDISVLDAAEGCIQAISDDLNINTDSFEGHEELYMSVIEGAYHLLSRDAGIVSDDMMDDYVREVFTQDIIEISEHLDQTDARSVIYNMVMGEIEETKYKNLDNYAVASFNNNSGLMSIDGTLSYTPYIFISAVFVHEAAHGRVSLRHTACSDDSPYSGFDSCDEDWSGALGYEAAYLRMIYRSIDQDIDGCDTYTTYRGYEDTADYILSW